MLDKIKICGLSTPETVLACVNIGVGFIGFNFVDKSPRYISIDTSKELANLIPKSIKIVALVADADDQTISNIIQTSKPDYLQLHGHETLERVIEIKKHFNIPIIKAFGIADEQDIYQAKDYEEFIDIVLFDTKPMADAVVKGGSGKKFNWDLLNYASQISRPIMLAGGINISNIKEALEISNIQYLDICSGVESSKGIKSLKIINELKYFI